jgi:hypothetical protein
MIHMVEKDYKDMGYPIFPPNLSQSRKSWFNNYSYAIIPATQ